MKISKLTSLFFGMMAFASVAFSQSNGGVDTIVVFDPDTKEETTYIVKSNSVDNSMVTEGSGSECYVFQIGAVSYDTEDMTDMTQTMPKAMVIDNLKKGVKVTSKSGCPAPQRIIDYTLDVTQSNGNVVSYDYDKAEEMTAHNPFMYERIVMNARSLTYRDVKVQLQDNNIVSIDNYTMVVKR